MNIPGKIEAVWWQDAYVTTDDKPEFDKEHLTLTVGHVVKQDKTLIYISNYYDGIGETWDSPWTAVPKAWVKKRLTLK